MHRPDSGLEITMLHRDGDPTITGQRRTLSQSLVSEGPKAASLPKYAYIMEDVDELVKLIFEVGELTQNSFT